jgi:PIN domain nuclease of toxin-antitoxin system
VRLLLDTNALLWALEAPESLRGEVRTALSDRANEVHVSIASICETAIKAGTGKLTLPRNFVPVIGDSGFRLLAITTAHALHVATLPRHHRDPFDRLLVAQAIVEGLTLVTRDATMPLYGIPILAA